MTKLPLKKKKKQTKKTTHKQNNPTTFCSFISKPTAVNGVARTRHIFLKITFIIIYSRGRDLEVQTPRKTSGTN